MKRTTIKFASIGIALLFAIAVIYLIVGIVSDYHFRIRQTESLFERLVSNTSQMTTQYDPFSPEFKSTFFSDTELSDQFQTIHIDCNGSSLFSPKATVTASSFIKEYTASFTDPRGNSITISGTLYTLTPALIFNRARLSFLLILAGTIAACILIFFEQLNTAFIDKNSTTDSDSDSDTIELIDETKDTDSYDYFTPETPEQDISATAEDDPPVEELASVEPEIVPAQDMSILKDSSALESTLDSDLIQAAASEEDLALLIVRITGLKNTDDTSEKIGSLFQERCGNTVSCFFYKNDGYACILHNTSLDNALVLAENIQKEIQNIISSTGIPAFAGIGIAARTSRLVSGKRLLTEADQAVSHAQEDPDSSIIAFRVNPEKYRQFIAENGDIPDIN